MRFQFLSPIHKASRRIGGYLEGFCGGFGLSNPEGHLISYLRTYEPAVVGDLLRVFGMKASTATSMLNRLEAAGLIERRVPAEDRRTVVVRLTRKGRVVGGKLQAQIAALEAAIRGGVNATEIEGFQAVMDAIARATAIPAGKEKNR
jgi:DNA-binding MarR family transcriptional regulator